MMTAATATQTSQIEHRISPALPTQKARIIVAGCGGTRSNTVSKVMGAGRGLATPSPPACPSAPDFAGFRPPPDLHGMLVDGNRISRANFVRPPFSESEYWQVQGSAL